MKKSNKKLVKILIFLAVVLMLVCCCTTAFAASEYTISGEISPTSVPFAGIVISVVQFGCYTAAVIWIMIVGLKYMTSSPDGKAEMKKQAMAALIGCFILFTIGSIIKWIYEVVPKS